MEIEALVQRIGSSTAEAMHGEPQHAASRDALTGLPNRRALEQKLQSLRTDRHAGRRLAAMRIDLDRFRQINDALGYAAGDHVLCHVARVLGDLGQNAGFAARVGDDEFVVLVDGDQPAPRLGRFAGRIIDLLSQPVAFAGQECRFGASVGIAVAETAAQHERLLTSADIALDRAKASGRNRWVMFTDRMRQDLLRGKALSDDLLRAVDRREFSVVYQPQVDARTEHIVGVEALLRWHHPERGVLTPREFLSTAEDLGIVGVIDRMVMQQATQDDAGWQSRGLKIPRIAVNVSGRRLRDPALPGDIRQGSIAPDRLSVEILESVFVDEEDQVLSWNIDQLREMGVEIELDDFGTGHSSIVGLIRLKPTRLKIDRHFVDQAPGT